VRIAVSLSDPWDLGEALGWPTLLGTVIHFGPVAWLVELTQPFTHAGSEYRFLVVIARHTESSLSNAISSAVPCNIVRTTPDRASGSDPCDISWWRGGGAMTGVITVAPIGSTNEAIDQPAA
jgi:hypothetical protein